MSFHGMFAFFLVSCAALNAQETNFVDLTLAAQRTVLRTPPAPPPECNEGICKGSGGGVRSVSCGAPDPHDPHALGVYLLEVTPTEINPADPFQAQFRILNTGLVPVEIPVSPDLSDLQPGDEAVDFSYFSLALVVGVEGDPASFGYAELYGSPDHEGTIRLLKPGEWVRVKANVKLGSPPSTKASNALRGSFWLRRNTFSPRPGGSFTKTENLYPNPTTTPSIPVHFVMAALIAGPQPPARRN